MTEEEILSRMVIMMAKSLTWCNTVDFCPYGCEDDRKQCAVCVREIIEKHRHFAENSYDEPE